MVKQTALLMPIQRFGKNKIAPRAEEKSNLFITEVTI